MIEASAIFVVILLLLAVSSSVLSTIIYRKKEKSIKDKYTKRRDEDARFVVGLLKQLGEFRTKVAKLEEDRVSNMELATTVVNDYYRLAAEKKELEELVDILIEVSWEE